MTGERMRGGGPVITTVTMAMLTIASLALAGCAGEAGVAVGTDGTTSAPTSTPSTFSPDDPLLTGTPNDELSDAVDLIGEWQVAEAAGEAPGTYVWISGAAAMGQTIMVFRDCGPLWVEWTGTSEVLATGSVGGDQVCFLGPEGDQPMDVPEIPWLTGAHGFRTTGDGVELLDETGEVLARLDPAVGTPPAAADWNPPGYRPTVDAESEDALRLPTPLAAGLTAAAPDDLLGTWTPVGIAEGSDPSTPATMSAEPPEGLQAMPEGWPERATITFRDDGRFTTDECRTVDPPPGTPVFEGHSWTGDGTGFYTPAYATNAMACWPSWPGWETRARTIALDNGYLRLFDLDGDELGRLERVG